MRYFTYISIIIIVFSGICAYWLFYQPGPQPPAAITINQRIISVDELQKALERRPSYQSRYEAAEQLISRELLIQEAMRLGLHEQKKFRQRVRAFYEKNLVQGLLEQKSEAFQADPPPAKLLARYAELMGQCLHLERTAIDAAAGQPVSTSVEKTRFADLSSLLRYKLALADIGHEAAVIRTHDQQIKYTVRGKTACTEPPAAVPPPGQIRQMIQNAARQAALDEWIDHLRQAAEVEILVPLEKNESGFAPGPAHAPRL